MKQNYDNLGYRGTVKDYSSFKIGDSVTIPRNHSLLRRSLSALFENEKSAMYAHAEKINCGLHTTDRGANGIEITFK
jgi:hypothetical protein